MDATGHVLVTGGPGSGKTTISILKAAQIAERQLSPGQRILFLSFARATVSRVLGAIECEQSIMPAHKRLIDVQTYHSYFWRILKTHGYLIGMPRRLNILAPPAEAVALAEVRSRFPAKKLSDEQKRAKRVAVEAERTLLAMEHGQVCFDLFAPYVASILHRSERIRNLIAAAYPVIVLDEFQDTNASQWDVVQQMGEFCKLIALADLEQQIFRWIGADPLRLDHFCNAFSPTEIDLGADNHRSAGSEIIMFGNDLLAGNFRQKTYRGVSVDVFEPFRDQAMTKLVTTTYAARTRLIKGNVEDWSMAILVPTKKMTRLVADALREPPAGMAGVPHTAVIELEAATLGAEVIAFLMQSNANACHFEQFIDLVCNYFLGKGGDDPTKSALREAAAIRKAYDELLARSTAGKSIRKNSILVNMQAVYKQSQGLVLTGDPDRDWLAVRKVMEDGACKRLKEIAEEVRNLRLLNRGTQLRRGLSQDWRDNGKYLNAVSIARQAFMQEHFSANAKPESGVVIMNMHKAKGKQFDEVIVFEGWPILQKGRMAYNPDRIVRFNSRDQVDDDTRQNFRVSVTRARRQTTILTPRTDICVLLI